MIVRLEPNATISDAEALSEYASNFISEFKNKFSEDRPLNVDCIIRQIPSGFTRTSDGQNLSPVYTQLEGSRLKIHLYRPALIGIPAMALQGWLDLELAYHVLNLRRDAFQFNFQRNILPLINVSGMALQVMRYLVSHLEAGLKQAMAVQMVLDMVHGQSLFYYYYWHIGPCEADKDSYRHLVAHHWTRAIFICKKSRDYVAVALLARQGLFAELKSYWWACHDYILPEDRHLMDELAAISHEFDQMRFSERLIAMFKTVQSYLLA